MMTAAMCLMLVIMIRGEGDQVMPALIQISMTHRDHNTVIMSSFSRKYREEVFDYIFSSCMSSRGGIRVYSSQRHGQVMLELLNNSFCSLILFFMFIKILGKKLI